MAELLVAKHGPKEWIEQVATAVETAVDNGVRNFSQTAGVQTNAATFGDQRRYAMPARTAQEVLAEQAADERSVSGAPQVAGRFVSTATEKTLESEVVDPMQQPQNDGQHPGHDNGALHWLL